MEHLDEMSEIIGEEGGLAIPSENLVSYWSLDETFADAVGSNDLASWTGDGPTIVSGRNGQSAYRFTTDVIRTNIPESFATNEVTFGGWFLSPSMSTNYYVGLVFGDLSLSTKLIALYPFADKAPYAPNAFGAYVYTIARSAFTDVISGEWHHFVCRLNLTTVSLVLDGVEILNESNTTPIYTSKQLDIGGWGTQQMFPDLTAQQVFLYNRYLDISEIVQIRDF